MTRSGNYCNKTYYIHLFRLPSPTSERTSTSPCATRGPSPSTGGSTPWTSFARPIRPLSDSNNNKISLQILRIMNRIELHSVWNMIEGQRKHTEGTWKVLYGKRFPRFIQFLSINIMQSVTKWLFQMKCLKELNIVFEKSTFNVAIVLNCGLRAIGHW